METEIGGKHFEVRLIPVRVRNQRTGSLLIFNDITERKQDERELIRRATTDGLTNLYNRIYFLELLDQARNDCLTSGAPISLALIDVDFFKNINDQYGHIAGDRVLQHFTAQLLDVTREIGVAGRMGGEEFAVFLPDTDGLAAYTLAEKLRQRVLQERPALSGIGDSANGIEYSISVGVAELEYAEMSIESWYNLADTCLYASKQKGRNQTTLAPKKAMPCK